MTTIPGKFKAFDEWMIDNSVKWTVDLRMKAQKARLALLALERLNPADIQAMQANAERVRQEQPDYKGALEKMIDALTEFSQAFGAWEAEQSRR